MDCGNWRGIYVLPAVSKVTAKVVLEQIKGHLEDILSAEQAGFRSRSSSVNHIYTLWIIIKQCI